MAERPEVSRGHSTGKWDVPEITGVRAEREGLNNGVSRVKGM